MSAQKKDGQRPVDMFADPGEVEGKGDDKRDFEKLGRLEEKGLWPQRDFQPVLIVSTGHTVPQGGEGQQHQQHRYSGEKGPEGRDELVIQPGYDQGGDDAQRDADELHQAVGKAAPCACRGGIHQQKAVGSREGTEYDEETVGLPYEHPHRAGDFSECFQGGLL